MKTKTSPTSQRGALDEADTQPSRGSSWVVAGVVTVLLCMISMQAQAEYPPTSFEFRFRGGADPGMRQWKQSGQMWTETYPSGQKSIFRVRKAPYQLKGRTGTLVHKVDEPDFFVFIPNIGGGTMDLWVYKAKGPWRFLATCEEYGPSSY